MKPIPLTETQMAELFRLRTENADYKQALEELGVTPEEARKGAERSREIHKMFADLQTENEALRKDAERYRWLANYLVGPETNHDDAIVSSNTKAEIDEAIDAAKGVK